MTRVLPTTVRGRVALAALAVLLVADWATGALSNANAQPDLAEYHAYALRFLAHHSLPSEYPPLSIAAFLLTLAPPTSSFALVFGTWMLIPVAAAYALLATAFGPAQGLWFLVYTVAGAAATVLERFDIIPALLVLAAFVALRRERWGLCYVLLAVATLFKLYPICLVPLVVIDQLRSSTQALGRESITRALRGLAAYSGIVAVGFGLAALIDPSRGFEVLGYAASRPLELESVPASLLWLLSLTGAVHVQAFYSYGSFGLIGDGGSYLAPAATVATVGALAFVYARQWAKRIDPVRAWVAALLVVIVTSKVLSAQYLIWVFPLVAAGEGFSATWLLIALLTTLVYPLLFVLDITGAGAGRMDVAPPLLLVIAVRNALLVVVTLQALLFVKDRSDSSTS